MMLYSFVVAPRCHKSSKLMNFYYCSCPQTETRGNRKSIAESKWEFFAVQSMTGTPLDGQKLFDELKLKEVELKFSYTFTTIG